MLYHIIILSYYHTIKRPCYHAISYYHTIILSYYHTHTRVTESFYDSPPNFPSTKSPVLKPAPGRTSSNTVPLATTTSSIDSPLQTRKYVMILVFIATFLACVSISHETFVFEENRWFGGGYRRISRLCTSQTTN